MFKDKINVVEIKLLIVMFCFLLSNDISLLVKKFVIKLVFL